MSELRLTKDIVRSQVLQQEPPGQVRRIAAQDRLRAASFGDESDSVFKVLGPVGCGDDVPHHDDHAGR
jgi:regulator of RNase E activity RraA